MQTKTGSSSRVAITTIIVICLAQSLYFFIFNDNIDIVLFQLLYFPLIIVLTFIILWFTNEFAFHQYWINVYLGFFSFVLIFSIVNYMKNKVGDTSGDFPSGEANFDLFIFLLLYIFIQGIILLLLNAATYIAYKTISLLLKKQWRHF